jgi:hypothetical protein
MIGETLDFLGGRRSSKPRFMTGDKALKVGACFDPAQNVLAVGLTKRAEALPEQQGVFVTVSGGIEQILSDEPVADQVERNIGADAQEVQGDPVEYRVIALLKRLDDLGSCARICFG